jgi:hypothetical protein
MITFNLFLKVISSPIEIFRLLHLLLYYIFFDQIMLFHHLIKSFELCILLLLFIVNLLPDLYLFFIVYFYLDKIDYFIWHNFFFNFQNCL